MRIINMYTILSLLFLMPLQAIEVRTSQSKVEKSDFHNYQLYAKQFAETIKSHPPVEECHVLLHEAEKTVEIRIEFVREELLTYLSLAHNIRFVSQGDVDRYANNFKSAVKSSASEIFSELEQNSIRVDLQIK